MEKLTNADIMSVKGRGFLRNRGTDCFSGRVPAAGTVFTAQNFQDLAELADTYGNGKLIPIQWHHESKDAPFTFTLSDGTPLELGVGNTYVAFAPEVSPFTYQ